MLGERMRIYQSRDTFIETLFDVMKKFHKKDRLNKIYPPDFV